MTGVHRHVTPRVALRSEPKRKKGHKRGGSDQRAARCAVAGADWVARRPRRAHQALEHKNRGRSATGTTLTDRPNAKKRDRGVGKTTRSSDTPAEAARLPVR